MRHIDVYGDFIQLNEFLKVADIVTMGSDAKVLVTMGLVKVNNEVVSEVRKKLRDGDVVETCCQFLKLHMTPYPEHRRGRRPTRRVDPKPKE